MKFFCKCCFFFSLLSSPGGWDEVLFFECREVFCLTAVYVAYLHLWMGDKGNLKLMHMFQCINANSKKVNTIYHLIRSLLCSI